MILDIVKQDNPILRQIAEPVKDEDLKELVSNMIETVKSVDGAGLAAPQVGISKCLIVVKLQVDFLK